jgi:hypothetical protein
VGVPVVLTSTASTCSQGHDVGAEEPADPYADVACVNAAADALPQKDKAGNDNCRESGAGHP